MHDYLPTEITAADRIAARQRGRRRRGLRRAGVATAAIGLSLGSIGAAGIAGATVPAGTSPPAKGRADARSGRDRGIGRDQLVHPHHQVEHDRHRRRVELDHLPREVLGCLLADVTVGAHVAVVGPLRARPSRPPPC